MEVIHVNGYLMEEKYQIARKHLIPKQLREHGLKPRQLSFRKPVVEMLIQDYTRESGVRNLEKTIAKIIRNQARRIVENEGYNKGLRARGYQEYLRPCYFPVRPAAR
ncbi:MAG: hypothetical protein U5L09_19960 [Bacteroidales bacterium]|nr:hypothetical protein [Bacteroidales bacterium]